ncbi:MAG: MFS transporter [Spirochaetes bacterium]|nr:MFS transporter [Spirochaetota bacterium]
MLRKSAAPLSKNVIVCLVGSALTTVGDVFNDIAILSFVFISTSSVEAISWLYIAIYIAMMLSSLISGSLVDLWSKKGILVLSNLLLGGMMLVIAFNQSRVVIITCLFIETLLASTNRLAIVGVLKNSTTKSTLLSANAINTTVTKIASFVTPIAAGLILSLWPENMKRGFQIALLLDALSYFLVAFIFLFLSHKENNFKKRESVKRQSFFSDLSGSFLYIKKNKDLLLLTIFGMLLSLSGSIVFLIRIPYIYTNLQGNPSIQGLVNSFRALGAILGAFSVIFLNKLEPFLRITLSRMIQGICFILFTFIFDVPFALIVFFVQSLFMYFAQVNESSQRMLFVDSHRIGRVSGLINFFNSLIVLIILKVGPYIESKIGISSLYLFSGLWQVVVSIIFLYIWKKRQEKEELKTSDKTTF